MTILLLATAGSATRPTVPAETFDGHRVCSNGNGGVAAWHAPAEGSQFFLVVPTDGASTEGSYGTASSLAGRPSYLGIRPAP